MIEKEQGFRYLIGIEREGLRCDAKGVLASSMHPVEFGYNAEIVTPPKKRKGR